MKLDQLKKGFWGYKKASVYEYINMMEEEFSEKLAEKSHGTEEAGGRIPHTDHLSGGRTQSREKRTGGAEERTDECCCCPHGGCAV